MAPDVPNASRTASVRAMSSANELSPTCTAAVRHPDPATISAARPGETDGTTTAIGPADDSGLNGGGQPARGLLFVATDRRAEFAPPLRALDEHALAYRQPTHRIDKRDREDRCVVEVDPRFHRDN